MMTLPLAFAVYVIFALILMGLSRWLAASSPHSQWKNAPYASGEAPPKLDAFLRYEQFFIVALFFATLHLGILILSTARQGIPALLYLLGIITILGLLMGEWHRHKE